jgi:hypothetical protein
MMGREKERKRWECGEWALFKRNPKKQGSSSTRKLVAFSKAEALFHCVMARHAVAQSGA